MRRKEKGTEVLLTFPRHLPLPSFLFSVLPLLPSPISSSVPLRLAEWILPAVPGMRRSRPTLRRWPGIGKGNGGSLSAVPPREQARVTDALGEDWALIVALWEIRAPRFCVSVGRQPLCCVYREAVRVSLPVTVVAVSVPLRDTRERALSTAGGDCALVFPASSRRPSARVNLRIEVPD